VQDKEGQMLDIYQLTMPIVPCLDARECIRTT